MALDTPACVATSATEGAHPDCCINVIALSTSMLNVTGLMPGGRPGKSGVGVTR